MASVVGGIDGKWVGLWVGWMIGGLDDRWVG